MSNAKQLESRIRAIEQRVAAANGLTITEALIDLSGPIVRVLTTGTGDTLVHINGISAPVMGLAPLIAELPGFRHVLVDLPGHSLAPPYDWQGRSVRELAVDVVTGTLDALNVTSAAFVGSSLGGLFTLWTMLDAPARVTRAAIVATPATALPGTRVIPEFTSLTSPVRGRIDQSLMRLPSPRSVARLALTGAIGKTAARAMSDDMLDLHRLPLRLPGQAASYRALLCRLLDGGAPRPENILTDEELAQLAAPSLFVWGNDDVFCSPEQAEPSVAKIPSAKLVAIQGGHAPWFDDAASCAVPVRAFLADNSIRAAQA
ncbi:alpha/beta fold hydrolase [Nocardia camponoti]|uniref:Pimeloyl-[acyl-carrier protein] methyl ester esterase n=1 Tax=Nocardia camponoti TaxID=1616106 RepID=A0A917VDW5_9NOCA|nr:alpha/beta hydrolase [Nocardia camponoti]GGK68319.1 pimeloyl-[acyl-carrier protein] methyl ester esterase [Nocardia camponoti]